MTKQAVFLLFSALLLAACDNGVVLDSSSPPEAVLYPPSGMSVKALSPVRAGISWSPVPAAVQYTIYRGSSALPSPPASFPLLTTLPPSSKPSYEDTGLSAGQYYYYKVAAVDDGGNELSSGYYPVTPLAQLQTPVPRGNAQSPVSIRLDWDTVPDAVNYEIYKASVPFADPPPPLGPL
ncbi:MAG: hypothetical protein LBJ24_06700, partial [Treponema sp.]|nr:hypothetical protein [Treponema sp.]